MKICFFSSSESILKFYTACLLSRLTNASDSCDDFGTIHLKKKKTSDDSEVQICATVESVDLNTYIQLVNEERAD